MRLSLLLALAASSVAMADYMCPANPSMTDAKAIAYGYTIQGLLEKYYASVLVNASFFSDLPMSSVTASNGMTLAENTVMNVNGLAKQAMLGAEALMDMGHMLGLTPPSCDYTFPMAPNGTAHLMNAFYFEATMCGAFIGLADYFQSPTLNLLSARLAAEHGIHASALKSMMKPVGFMANSTMLTAAFTPEMVLQDGMQVGMLNTYLGGCVSAPPAPCRGTVTVGPLLSTLSGQSNMMSNSSSVGTMPGAAGGSIAAGISGSAPMASKTQAATAQFTGAANIMKPGAVLSAAVMMIYLMI